MWHGVPGTGAPGTAFCRPRPAKACCNALATHRAPRPAPCHRAPDTLHSSLRVPQDPLNCPAEEIVKGAMEKNHPNLNKAFAECGMPWAQGKLGGGWAGTGWRAGGRAGAWRVGRASSWQLALAGQACCSCGTRGAVAAVAAPRRLTRPAAAALRCAGNQESVKKALRVKGHERLMRVVKVLTGGWVGGWSGGGGCWEGGWVGDGWVRGRALLVRDAFQARGRGTLAGMKARPG